MSINGDIYLVDEENISVAIGILRDDQFSICIDTDDEESNISKMFPDKCQKGTILNPPPSAVYDEIDGDHESFINKYNEYLDSEVVTDYIAAMLSFMRMGGRIVLYIPSFSEDSIWVNTFIVNIFTRFGITIGQSLYHEFSYDPRYDEVVVATIYKYGYMDIFSFINSYPNDVPPFELVNKIDSDLSPMYADSNDNYMSLYTFIRSMIIMNGVPIVKPLVVFN